MLSREHHAAPQLHRVRRWANPKPKSRFSPYSTIWIAIKRSRLTVPAEDARLLRLLTESINAKHVVELGTANGYSGIWLALALQSTGGKLTTFEIDPQRVKQAQENFKRAGVDQLITIIQGDAHKGVTQLTGPIDLVFIDADKDGYVDYLNKLLPLVRPGGLVVAHNMRVPSPDHDRARRRPRRPRQEVSAAIDRILVCRDRRATVRCRREVHRQRPVARRDRVDRRRVRHRPRRRAHLVRARAVIHRIHGEDHHRVRRPFSSRSRRRSRASVH